MIPPSTPIGRLGLSVRTSAVLRLAGVKTFGQLAKLSADQLRALPNFLPACLEELRDLVVDRTPTTKVEFLTRDEAISRLKAVALRQAYECQRIGDQWAGAMAELELTTTRLASLAPELCR